MRPCSNRVLASSLEADRGPLTVWTKLQRKRSHGTDSLQAQLAVALAKDGNQEWWGGSLDACNSAATRKRCNQGSSS